MNRHFLTRLPATGISMLALSDAANANAGVPMLFVTLPAMILALAPIIVIEAIVIGRTLRSPAISHARSVTISNAISTIVGIPITWLALVASQIFSGGSSAHGLSTPMQKFLAVTWQAPWLIPYESELHWMLPAASLSLLIPFFFASVFIETPIVSNLECSHSRSEVKTAVFRANAVSYALLALLNFMWLLWSIQHGP